MKRTSILPRRDPAEPAAGLNRAGGQSPSGPQPRRTLSADRARGFVERVIGSVLFAAGAVSVLTTAGIVIVLIWESVGFFRRVSIGEFLTGTHWTPLFEPQHFGVLPLVAGSILVAAIAGLIAIPLGLGAAKRSEERRVGKECYALCRSRWSPYH